MWGTWFGGNSAQSRRDAPKKAILDLRQQLDMLQKRERHLENQMAKQDEVARENVSSNKTGRQLLDSPRTGKSPDPQIYSGPMTFECVISKPSSKYI